MKKIRNTIVALALALAAVSTSASNVAASSPDCTRAYMGCLNEALSLEAIAEEMGSLECGADWVGCTASKLRFW